MPSVLECEHVTKSFGGLVALRDVTFDIAEGEIFAVVGPNGAGKTTLFEVISGFSPASSGRVRFHGRSIERLRPDQVCRLGVVRSFQSTVSFRSQSVLANVLVGSVFGSGSGGAVMRFKRGTVEAALDALEFFGLLPAQSRLASTLSVYELKRLMLATAMATGAEVYLLDEPFGGLNADERSSLVDLLRRLRARGTTIVMIEHVMRAVHDLADRMMVLHHGEKLLEGHPSDVLRDERTARVYLGQPAPQT